MPSSEVFVFKIVSTVINGWDSTLSVCRRSLICFEGMG